MSADDMTFDYFADTDYGRAALKKMAQVPENFRLVEAEIVNKGVMKVTGAVFRKVN